MPAEVRSDPVPNARKENWAKKISEDAKTWAAQGGDDSQLLPGQGQKSAETTADRGGFIPGMIKGHHALTDQGTLKLPETIALQTELMTEYSKEEFQMKLYAGWYATSELVERHKWRQAVCMEIQKDVFPNYGFEPTRRGVMASGYACRTLEHGTYMDGQISVNFHFMDWLINPDSQEKGVPPGSTSNFMAIPATQEGDLPSSGYHIFAVTAEDHEAIRGVARCQGALAGAHQALFQESCPGLEVQDWFHTLGCGSVLDAIERGVLVLVAVSLDTKRVAGYISCTCNYGSGKSGDSGGSFAHINNLVVMNQHRGHGVGKMLFDELQSHLTVSASSVLGDMRISVAERNTRAKDWYQRLGFSVVDTFEVLGRHRVKFLSLQRKMDAGDFEDMFGS